MITMKKQCDKPLLEQVQLVAEFHAHKIKPERISYRTGVSLELINNLLAGRSHARFFAHCLKVSRQNYRQQRLRQAARKTGAERLYLERQFSR